MSGCLLKGVEDVLTVARLYAGLPDSPEPPVPAGLATRADAIQALIAAVWWAARRAGRRPPAVPIGTTHVQRCQLNTHPIAALGALLVCECATKADLAKTQDYLMPLIGGKVATTGSIGHWTSPRMQRKHGYTIVNSDGRLCYVHKRPVP